MIKTERFNWRNKKDLEDYAGYIFHHKNNTLVPNAGSEGEKHFIVKSIIAYILRKKKIEFSDEVITTKGKEPGRIDLLNLNDKIIIEVETNLTEKIKKEKREKYDTSYINDFLFIDLKKVPENFSEAYKYLKQKIDKLDSD